MLSARPGMRWGRSSLLRTLLLLAMLVCSVLLPAAEAKNNKNKSRADRLVRAKRNDCEK